MPKQTESVLWTNLYAARLNSFYNSEYGDSFETDSLFCPDEKFSLKITSTRRKSFKGGLFGSSRSVSFFIGPTAFLKVFPRNITSNEKAYIENFLPGSIKLI